MHRFDDKAYLERFLRAVETHRDTNALPDEFARYDLPLDVVDQSEIDARCAAVKAFWTAPSRRNHHKQGALARALDALGLQLTIRRQRKTAISLPD